MDRPDRCVADGRKHHLILIAYAIVAACLVPFARWQINPDGIAYIVIARRILAGDWRGAVNSHWSPLFSWLLAPLLAIGIEPLLASKLLTFSAGAAAIAGMWSLSRFFTTRESIRVIVTTTFAVDALVWASVVTTPDLLLVALLLFYLRFTMSSNPERAGVCAGLAYLAKSYALPFFLVHFTVTQLVRRRRALTGVAAFLAVALPWIAIISAKSGHLTIGTAAAYNWSLFGPDVRGEHPMYTQGLIAPAAGALSAWDDPSRLRFPPWPGGMESVSYLAQLVARNALHLFGIVCSLSPLALLILGFALHRRDTLSMWMVFTATLFSAGFLPLLVEERYVWILTPLLLLIFASVVADRGRLLVAIVAISFVIHPISQLRLRQDGRIAQKEAADLVRNGLDLRGARLASSSNWQPTLYLNYFLGARDFGIPKPGESPQAAESELDRNCIDAFIVWGGTRPQYLNGFELAAVSRRGPVAIYVRDDPPSRQNCKPAVMNQMAWAATTARPLR